MKRTKALIVMSLCIIPLIFAVVFADLAGTFSYSDVPFLVSFLFYVVFIIVQRTKSSTTFGLTLFYLIWMGLSYIPTGAGKVTERLGEWFYLYLVFGLAQYFFEAFTYHNNRS